MIPALSLWLPAVFMILAIWIGLIYNNRRLDDLKDLLRSEICASEQSTLRAILDLRTELKTEIAAVRADLARLEGRVANLERPTFTQP